MYNEGLSRNSDLWDSCIYIEVLDEKNFLKGVALGYALYFAYGRVSLCNGNTSSTSVSKYVARSRDFFLENAKNKFFKDIAF